jgi:hypothetical protein
MKRPKNCECDNTHENNNTCCRFCWDKGFRTVNRTYYKVIDSSGLAFGKNFDGMELEYCGRHHITNQLILKQPENGFVMMDDKSVVLVDRED